MQSDEALARSIQQGHMQDLQVLVDRYQGPLFGYLYRLTGGDGPLAEDLVQEAFVRVLHAISQYQYPRPFKPWLYSIATNLGRDHYKRLSTRQTTAMSDHLLEQADPQRQTMPEAVAIAQDEASVSQSGAAKPAGAPARDARPALLPGLEPGRDRGDAEHTGRDGEIAAVAGPEAPAHAAGGR